MCGIFVAYNSKKKVNQKIFSNSLALQNHRGPDSKGIINVSDNLVFGNVRLSITDLSSNSNQPMVNAKTSNVITFNGDIYNYIELKEKLKIKGHNFFSTGDTEVLLKHIESEGLKGIDLLNGKWAFTFYNKEKNNLIISRDRFGKQPLYYYIDDQSFIVSSEIKSIYNFLGRKRILKKTCINDFLNHGYINNENDETIYKNINKLPAGLTGVIDLNNTSVKIKFFGQNTIRNHLEKSSSMSLEELIFDSVKLRLRNDVKNAAVISGGIDSTIVATFANQINKDVTFVTGNSGVGKDLYFSRKLAKDLKINLVEVNFNENENMIQRIHDMTKIFEIPISIYGQVIAMNILYEKVSDLKVRVLLDGAGGDEIYSGYFHRYTQHFLNSLIQKKKFDELLSFMFHSIKNNQVTIKEFLKFLTQNFGNKLFNLEFKNNIFRYLKLNHDLHPTKKDKIFYTIEKYQQWDVEFGSMPQQLQISDSNSMMYSLTTRNPLLDFRQIYNIENDTKNKFYGGYNKYLLRKIIPNIISNEIIWRPDKQPLKWNYEEKFLIENQIEIFDDIEKSAIINKLIEKKYMESIKNKFNQKKNRELILRCFALASLEKKYNCEID